MTLRANGKMKLLPSVFSCVYSRVKLFVFAGNSRRLYVIFVCFTYVNVLLILSIIKPSAALKTDFPTLTFKN